MNKYSHFLVGAVIGWAFLYFLPFSHFLKLGLIYFFGWLGTVNDGLDFTVLSALGHRNVFTHSFISPCFLLIGTIVYAITGFFLPSYSLLFAFITILILESHVLIDALTPSGVYLTFSRKIAWKMESNSWLFNSFFIIPCSILLFSTWI